MPENIQEQEVAEVVCGNCGQLHPPDNLTGVGGHGLVCDTCFTEQFRECYDCGESDQWYDMVSTENGLICRPCLDDHYFYCNGCEQYLRDRDYGGDDLCTDCYEDRVGDEDEEEIDYGIGLGFTPRAFGKMRGEMMTSVELEFTNDPSNLSSALYRKGLAPTREVDSYTASGNGSATVKTDGSINFGGEVVISKLQLPRASETARLWACVNELRTLVHNGENGLNTECGCHIHIDAAGLTMDDVVSSVVVFGYLEDVLYRIGAANYSGGHRCLTGNSYTNLTPKNPSKDPSRFRASFGSDRYFGLNVSNWIQGRYDCSCGVGFAAGDRCTCGPFRKNTIEFRLYNTTANPIKLLAYIALSQAIVAYGKGKDLSPNDLPAMEFSRSHQPHNTAMSNERIRWMFENLPLSVAERNAIRYCIRKSSLHGYVDSAFTQDESMNAPLKADDSWPAPVKRRRPRSLPPRLSNGQFAAPDQVREEQSARRLYEWTMGTVADESPDEPTYYQPTYYGCNCASCQRLRRTHNNEF